MSFVDIKALYTLIGNNLDADLEVKYKKGCNNNILRFVKQQYPEGVKDGNGNIYIYESLVTDVTVKEYYKKVDFDMSAKDCAYLALNHPHIPPYDVKIIDSLEKIIRESQKGRLERVIAKLLNTNAFRSITG